MKRLVQFVALLTVVLLEAAPANFGCGQPSPSMAAFTREASLAGPAPELGGTAGLLAMTVLTPPVSARAGSVPIHPALEDHDPVDRGVLFHVFRI